MEAMTVLKETSERLVPYQSNPCTKSKNIKPELPKHVQAQG